MQGAEDEVEGSVLTYVTKTEFRKQRSRSPSCNSLIYGVSQATRRHRHFVPRPPGYGKRTPSGSPTCGLARLPSQILYPCFNGIWSARGCGSALTAHSLRVLILVLMEYGLRAKLSAWWLYTLTVLILVLMKYGLRAIMGRAFRLWVSRMS